MEDILSIVDSKLRKGELVFSDLVPLLSNALNSNIPQNLPMRLKTMIYYKVIDIKSDVSNVKLIEVLSQKKNLIDEQIEIDCIQNLNDTLLDGLKYEDCHLLDPIICRIKNARFRGASHPYFLGILFLCFENFKNDSEVLISYIHELAHQELFLINLVDRLVTETSSPRMIHAPYQNKVRPSIGRLHSAHALFRMIRLEQVRPTGNIGKFQKYLEDTIKTFDSGELTKFGEKLIQAYRIVL